MRKESLKKVLSEHFAYYKREQDPRCFSECNIAKYKLFVVLVVDVIRWTFDIVTLETAEGIHTNPIAALIFASFTFVDIFKIL